MPTDSDVSEDSENDDTESQNKEEEKFKKPIREKKQRSYSITTGDMSDQEKKKRAKLQLMKMMRRLALTFKSIRHIRAFKGAASRFLYCRQR